jgi:LysR family cyn operon transcriptional activator
MHQEHLSMELRHLRGFVAIVDAGGVAQAAMRLHVSQPALSRQILALEGDLGLRLFDRVGRRLRLTPPGEDLLLRSRQLLADAESLGERALALKAGETGVLRVGATPQVIETLLADFLGPYGRRHPGVDIHLIEDGGARLPARLERGHVQLALMPAGDARFEQRALAPVYVMAVMSPAHRLSRHALLDIHDLADTPLLLLRSDFGSRVWFDAACQVAHVRTRVVLESGAPHTLIALARVGYGVAVVPSNAHVPRTGVRAVPLTLAGAPIGRWAAVSWDSRRFLASYAVAFVDELLAYVRRGYPGRELTRCAPPLPRPGRVPGGPLTPPPRPTVPGHPPKTRMRG